MNKSFDLELNNIQIVNVIYLSRVGKKNVRIAESFLIAKKRNQGSREYISWKEPWVHALFSNFSITSTYRNYLLSEDVRPSDKSIIVLMTQCSLICLVWSTERQVNVRLCFSPEQPIWCYATSFRYRENWLCSNNR